MSLRWKVVLLLCGVFVVLMGMIRLIDDSIVFPSFVRLEREEAATDMSRCVRALESEIERLDTMCREWADAYCHFVDNPAECFQQPFSPDVLRNEDLGLLVIRDVAGKDVLVQARPPDANGDVAREAAFECALDESHTLLSTREPLRALRGLAAVGSHVLLASSRPIVSGADGGAPLGRVIVGRWLDRQLRDRIVERTQVTLDIWPIHVDADPSVLAAPGLADDVARATSLLADSTSVFLDDSDGAVMQAYCEQDDVDGAPIVLLRGRIERNIMAAGATARDLLLSAMVSLLVIILVLVWMQLEITVVKPIKRLRDHVARVGTERDLDARIEQLRQDEIGDLCRSFNDMTGSLAEYRRRLVDVAHRSGMSDTATNILHNVGNVLNSVFVSADVLSAAAEQSRVHGLSRAAELIQSHRHDLGEFFTADERGRKLPDYLVKLSELLSGEQKTLAAEVRSLQDKVQHIRDVIATQQALAAGPRLISRERLEIIVREAAAMHEELLRRQGISLTLALADVPPVRVSRPKLIQVLDNLIKNAAEAIVANTGAQERCITLRSAPGEANTVQLHVADTGIGFEPSMAEQIFRCGFTTKADGHGFGLHYCANALTEMGGRINAESAGRGQGSTFLIIVPADREAVTA